MDEDTKQFLTALVSGLENNLRREISAAENSLRRDMRETEARILQRTDELVSEAKTDLSAA